MPDLLHRRANGLVAVVVAVLALGCIRGQAAGADQTVRFDGPAGAPHISLIGDSTLTGVRWYADYGALRSFDFVLNAESCRRTIEQSCISREGYRSENVLSTMRDLDGELGELLVVMSGYNDPRWTIDEAIDGVVTEAKRQGVEHVVWLSLRTSPDVDYSDPQEQSSINTFRAYNDQLTEAAAASDGYLQVADWATWSNGASGWFEYDGVHLTPRGVDALTTFLAGIVDRVLAGEDVSPAEAPWTVLVPGAEGGDVAAVQSALLEAGVDVRGGADGVFGYDTMAAVADYQRESGDLLVTGAVDVATAQALGVYDAAEIDDDVTDGESPTDSTADAQPTRGDGEPDTAESASGDDRATAAVTQAGDAAGGGSGTRWFLVPAGVIGALALAVLARRRYVVARRRARRWARVHPSTSPHRSVADLRRSGELPNRDAEDADQPVLPRSRRSNSTAATISRTTTQRPNTPPPSHADS